MSRSTPRLRPLILLCTLALPLGAHAELKTAVVARGEGGDSYRAEGVVEAVRHTELAAQVYGRITALPVKAGDRVAAGAQVAAVDARAAHDQQAAARAQFETAQRDYERSRELFAKRYISKTAMDRAESEFRVARAQAQVANTQTDFHTIAAPYAGVVADVLVEVGDMAQPGKPLLQFYDPAQLRITAQVPETVAAAIDAKKTALVELPTIAPDKKWTATAVTVLPTANAVTHTREVRAELPKGIAVAPGAFARVALPLQGSQAAPLSIPASAVLTRIEFQGVYVVDGKGRVQLRQVRLGQRSGDRIEVLAGLRDGERIALDPLLALRATQIAPKPEPEHADD